jgi:NodT family efflux transporter outer membrane factor (OMF) lipoprotein
MALNTRRLLSLIVASSLSGCVSVGPDFVSPSPVLPITSFFGKPTPIALPETGLAPLPPADPRWWATFHDPILTHLEEQAVTANLDLRRASVSIAQSLAQRDVSAATALPTLSGSGRYNHGELLASQIQASNASLNKTLGSLASPPVPPFSVYQTGLNAAWEIDLWGRVRRQIEAADAQVDVSEDDRRAMLTLLLAEVARDYIQLRGTQEQIAIVKDNLLSATEILGLARARTDRGLVNGLDAENAAAEVESIKAQLPPLHTQEIQSMNALAQIIDQPPGALQKELARARPIPPAPAKVPLGIPSEIARRRPDIRQAEAQLHAATANIGVAVADFYPSVRLNGSVGYDGLELQNAFKATALQYMVGPQVSVPIFQGGRLRSTLELREAQQQSAALSYQGIVLQAWHEVVNALVAYRDEQQRHALLKAQIDHSRQALTLSRTRYTDGVTEFITVLDAERSLFAALQQYATSTTNVSLDLVQLYRALGGGWETIYPQGPLPELYTSLGPE